MITCILTRTSILTSQRRSARVPRVLPSASPARRLARPPVGQPSSDDAYKKITKETTVLEEDQNRIEFINQRTKYNNKP